MKIKSAALLLCIAVVSVSCNSMFNLKAISGDGNVVTEERAVSSFEKIEIGGSADVHLYSSNEYRLTITTDSNLIEYFETSVHGNTLIVKQKPGWKYSFTKQTVNIYCPHISSISISGSCHFEAVDKITAPKFNVKVSGSGKVNGTVECDDLTAHLSGSGNINIFGNAKSANISISGSGKVNGTVACDDFSAHITGSGRANIIGKAQNADIGITGSGSFSGDDFVIQNCSATITGSGNLNVFAENRLKARITGSGNIKYKGNPTVDFKKTGSGRMTKN